MIFSEEEIKEIIKILKTEQDVLCPPALKVAPQLRKIPMHSFIIKLQCRHFDGEDPVDETIRFLFKQYPELINHMPEEIKNKIIACCL